MYSIKFNKILHGLKIIFSIFLVITCGLIFAFSFSQFTVLRNTYTITASTGPGGIISPHEITTLMEGSNQTYSITPNSEYKVSSVLVDGISVGAVSSYTFINLQSAHTISVAFTIKPGNLIVSQSGTTFTAQDKLNNQIYSGNSATLAIQIAMDYSQPEDTVFIKNGTYSLTTTINGKSGVSIAGLGNSTIIDCTGLARETSAISYRGTWELSAKLTSDAMIGESSITSTSVNGISPGDLLLIQTNAVWKNNLNRGQLQGEIRKVDHVSGTTIYLTQPLQDTYKMENSAKYQEIAPVKDFTISDMKLVNTVNYKNLYGISIYYGANIRVTGLYLEKIEQQAIGLDYVIDSRVDHNIVYRSWMMGSGYGTAMGEAAQNITVEYNLYTQCRHAIAIGGGPYVGIPRDLYLQYNKSFDAVFLEASGDIGDDYHYDCHNVGENINYLYNEASGRGTGFDGVGAYTGLYKGNYLHDLTGVGIVISNPYSEKVIFEDNVVLNIRGDYGILIGSPYNSNLGCPNVIVRNNQVTEAYYGIAGYGATNLKITNNTVKGSRYAGILIQRSDNVEVSNNTIRESNGNSFSAVGGIIITSSSKNTQIHDNDLLNSGYLFIIQDKGVKTVISNNLGYP